jgi:glutamate synthase (NADPH/NADH) small chain
MKSNTTTSEEIITYQPRARSKTDQGLMPGRYRLWVQLFSMAAFTLAFVGWLNETWLFWFDNPIWLNRYTEYAIILGFGIWRIVAEKNSYTRKRLIVLVAVVTGFWWLIPWLMPFTEPYVGFLWAQPVFPSLHAPGTLTFFIVLGLVFLFGRRVICGWGCPCVGIRETVGFAFRDRTVRSKWAWRLRHSKWFFFIYYVGVMIVTQYPPNGWTVSFVGGFYGLVALTYFGTFFLAPLVGNRSYCRYFCPFGATFGLLNHAGAYGINMDTDKCIDCRRCEQVCDMGIPVWQQGKESGRVTGIEDCMGCGRCVVSCPTDALAFRDARNLFRPKLVQNASHLLKRPPPDPVERQGMATRAAEERRLDWNEIEQTPALADIQRQAARCIDCGVPGCSNACPLSNRIPEWLEAAAAGEIEKAASIAHTTSNFPEICGRLCPQHTLCEGACTKAGTPEGAVTIGAIERYISDEALRLGWRLEQGKGEDNNQRVAIIGAGPAGLACAEQLNRAGYRVTVYDRQLQIGGLLASGVPPFKLDKSILARRHQVLEQAGVEFHLGVDVDQAMMKTLLHDNDALFLGMGAQGPRRLELSGADLPGVSSALHYLARVNARPESVEVAGKRVIVLGGGDSAMDCARAAIRQGAMSVTVAYRGMQEFMLASPREQQSARDEGVQFLFEYTPTEVMGETEVIGVRFRVGKNGREEATACDQLMVAFGQLPNPPAWFASLGIACDERGVVSIDEQGRTSHPGIYAGGDNTHGPDLIVTAVAAGRRAAETVVMDHRPLQRLKGRLLKVAVSPDKSGVVVGGGQP